MEYELNRMQMAGHDTRMDTTLLREETLEMIVPDACPDILRVIETDGGVLLSRKEAQEGKVELAGVFLLSVLYLPDGEEALRHLDVTIPFTCAAEGREIDADCAAAVSLRLCRADTRALNPRKILVRAEAAADITVYAPHTLDLPTGIAGESEGTAEQLTQTHEVYLTDCVQEKPFSLSEEIALSSGKPAALEVLKSRVTLTAGESRIIGNKLIFKGCANVTVFYRGEDSGIYTACEELPFSQIMEVFGVTEEAECDLRVVLTGWECRLDPGNDGRTVLVNIEALAQAAVWENREIEVLADAYSISAPMEVRWESLGLNQRVERGTHSQNFRELWELPGAVREVIDCRLTLEQVTKQQEGEKLALSVKGELQALLLGEDGTLGGAVRPITAVWTLEIQEGCICLSQCMQSGEVYAVPTSAGIEVRFNLDLLCCVLSRKELTVVSEVGPGEATLDEGAIPSLVLRRLEKGERLWDVAKAYGTTITDIFRANELKDASDAVGQLLLIPRKR